MEVLPVVLLISAGILVGFINTLAGGGSVISLSILMFLGLPANVANGTNRIGILLQTLVSTRNFHIAKSIDWKKGLFLAIPAVIGSLIGSQFASTLNKETFEFIIGGLLLFIMIMMIVQPEKWIKEDKTKTEKKISALQIIIFLGIGFYGGFIQAGVGFFLLSGLVWSAGYELVKANALKNLIVLLYTPFALAVFLINDQVHLLYGLILALGNMTGAYLASKLALKKGASFVRWIVFAVIIVTALKLFHVIDFKELFPVA